MASTGPYNQYKWRVISLNIYIQNHSSCYIMNYNLFKPQKAYNLKYIKYGLLFISWFTTIYCIFYDITLFTA